MPTLEELIAQRRANKTGGTTSKGRLVASKQETPKPSRTGKFVKALTEPIIDLPDAEGLLGTLQRGLEGVTSPLGIASAGLAPVARTGAVAGRIAKEVAVGAAGNIAAEGAEEVTEGLPAPLQIGAQIGAAVLAGNVTARGLGNKVTPSRIKVLEQEDLTRSISDFNDPVDKIAFLIRNAKPMDKAIEAARKPERSRRVGAFAGRVEARGGTLQAYRSATSELAGELPDRRFEPLTDLFSEDELNQVITRINESNLLPLERLNTVNALADVWANGAMPRAFEIDLLKKVYGDDFVASILKHQTQPELWRKAFYSGLNLPRAVMASIDLSAPLRQGALLAPGNAKEFFGAMRPMLKAWGNEDYAKQVMANIESMDEYKAMKAAGLDFSVPGSLDAREEAFMYSFSGGSAPKVLSGIQDGLGSSLLGAGVRSSERAYSTFLNKLRADVFAKTARNWEGAGKTTKDYEDLAKFINYATGRGKLPKDLTRFSPFLTATFFAPKLLYSRFAAPSLLATASPSVKALVAKDLGLFFGIGIAMLTMLKFSGIPGVSVEHDPRSTDFGKVKWGDTRYDFWAGYQPIARYLAQTVTGQQKGMDGRIRDIDRSDRIMQFFRSKGAPVPGFAYDLLKGQTFLGEEIRGDDTSIPEQVAGAFTPLFIQNVVDGIREEGIVGGIKSIPAGIGVGVAIYTSVPAVQNEVAQEKYGRSYRDLGYSQQQVVKADPRVIQKEQEFDNRVTTDYHNAARAIDEHKLKSEQVLSAQYRAGILDGQDFADGLGKVRADAYAQKKQAQKDFKVTFLPPDSPLQVALDGYYRLFDQASRGYEDGVITTVKDWEKFDQLEQQYMARLSPEQRLYVEDRKKEYADPTVEFFDKARKYVSESGYYDTIDDAFTKNKRAAQRVLPGANDMGDLLQAANLAQNSGDLKAYKRYNQVINKIESDASESKMRLRKKDARLDAELFSIGRVSTVAHRQNIRSMR